MPLPIRRLAWMLVILILLAACRPAAPVLTSTAPTDVERLVPFLEPEAHSEPVIAAINSAKRTVRMESYLLNASEVVDALQAAQKRGVEVRVILDAEPAGTGTGNKPALRELAAESVGVRMGSSAYKRMHARFIVIDDRTVVIMTLDQTQDAFAVNREFGITDSDPIDVADAISVFEADWNGTPTSALVSPNLVLGPDTSRRELIGLIDTARQTLDLESEHMQDEEIEAHLTAAVQRGVIVRVVMSPAVSGPDLNLAGRERISSSGVKVRMLKVPYIHALMIVADSTRGFIGSQDLTPLSLDASRELGIITTDARIVKGLAGTFLVDWDIGR